MGKAVKSVKKFVKKGHLGATIARRRKLKPMNNALRKKKAGKLIAGDNLFFQRRALRRLRSLVCEEPSVAAKFRGLLGF